MARQRGLTLIEVLIVLVIIGIITSIAIPQILRKHGCPSSGTVCTYRLRNLAAVNEQYRQRFHAYADSLGSLESTGSIDSLFASGTYSGYDYVYAGSDETWTCQGTPINNYPGAVYFFVDQSGIIRFDLDGPAGLDDPAVGDDIDAFWKTVRERVETERKAQALLDQPGPSAEEPVAPVADDGPDTHGVEVKPAPSR